ncbi:hypothetical protein [Xanthomonas medicagonis]|uniref:hypothetical protein n=1 Tax=Xanthomonas medicagonis TaxID=3160841 RepID=UPI0035140BAA
MLTIHRLILVALPLCLLASQAYAENAATYLVHMKVFSAEKLVEQTTVTLKERQMHHWTGGHDGVNFDVTLTLAEFNVREALYRESVKVTRAVKPGTDDICSNGQGSGRVVYGTESRLFNVTNTGDRRAAIPAGCALVVTVSRMDANL